MEKAERGIEERLAQKEWEKEDFSGQRPPAGAGEPCRVSIRFVFDHLAILFIQAKDPTHMSTPVSETIIASFKYFLAET